VALSKKFRWVEVNRDHTPAIPKLFSVNAYPSLIVIGAKREKIYRFQSFMPPNELIKNLQEGLRRYGLYKSGKEWDRRTPRAATICDDAAVQTFRAPSEEQPGGLAVLGGKLFVAQGAKLHQVDLLTGKTEKSFDLPRPARGLCTDGRFVYAIDYGWTAGKPIYVFDPAEGKVVREIVTQANKVNRYMAASGITFIGDRLFVLSRRSDLSELDLATGAVIKLRKLPEHCWKLAFDGEHLISASHVSANQQHLLLIDPNTLKVVRRVPLNYGISAIACRDGAILMMEHPVRGFDTNHKPVRIYPDQMLIHQVRLTTLRLPKPKTGKKK